MRQHCRAILILLLAIGIPCSQVITLGASHSYDHSSHCCGVCHTGHLSILHAAHDIGFLPIALVSRHRPAEEPIRALEPLIVLSHSRAPPA